MWLVNTEYLVCRKLSALEMTWPVNTTEVVRTSKTKLHQASSLGNDCVFWEWFVVVLGNRWASFLATSFIWLYLNSPILSVWFQYHQPSEIPAPYIPTTKKTWNWNDVGTCGNVLCWSLTSKCWFSHFWSFIKENLQNCTSARGRHSHFVEAVKGRVCSRCTAL